MIRNDLFRLLPSFNRIVMINARNASSSNINIEKLEQESANEGVDVANEDTKASEEEIEQKRNKSRLRHQDREFLFERNPYPESNRWHQGTIKYIRRLYGRYGEASGVDPTICWPTKQELRTAKELERVSYPFAISQMINDVKAKRVEKNERIQARQEDIAKRLLKLDQWKQDLQNRIAKKEGEASAARQRKERLIDEVRMHFGYTVDPRDEKFKEMVEKKEKEQKKAMKEEKRKTREENLLAKMLAKKNEK